MNSKYPFKRDFYNEVVNSIAGHRATFLLGPRKCGKTVCLKQINEAYPNSVYVDFKKLTNYEGLDVFQQVQHSIENDEDKIYLLDEITYAPNPEINICIIESLFTEYNTKQIRLVFSGGPSRALEMWSSIAFGGCGVGHIKIDFLSYAEWLRYMDIPEPSEESYEQFLFGAADFCGVKSMEEYLQGCLDETVLSNDKTRNIIWGNDCERLSVKTLLDVCYMTLFTLRNQMADPADYSQEDIDAFFEEMCKELNLDQRISKSFVDRHGQFKKIDFTTLEQAFLFLKKRGLITVTPVDHQLDETLDIEREFTLIAHGDNPQINYRDGLFRTYNMCIKYPAFYVALLRDILQEQMPNVMPRALLGSIVEGQVRGLLPSLWAIEYHDKFDNEIDYVNTAQEVAVEITITNKPLKDTHFDCLPEDYRCILLTKDRMDIVQGNVTLHRSITSNHPSDGCIILRIPYYEFIYQNADIGGRALEMWNEAAMAEEYAGPELADGSEPADD